MSAPTAKPVNFYIGRRLSYEGWLCTIRWIGGLSGTEGTWIGVEWDDVSRGKHDGVHRGERIFTCLSRSGTPASFVKSTRKSDPERTVLEAIRFKYGSNSTNDTESDIVIISGKVAEEVGFGKIAQEQAQLSELKIVLIDQLVVTGVGPRGSSPAVISQIQQELSETCPNIEELDLGFNVIESWCDISDICVALPKLRTLRACGLRFTSFNYPVDSNSFAQIKWLYVDDCLITASNIPNLLRGFTSLEMCNMCGNQFDTFPTSTSFPQISSVKLLYLDNNDFADLDCIIPIIQAFPNIGTLSFAANRITKLGQQLSSLKQIFPHINTLSIPDNRIPGFQFLESLSILFPNLASLRITGNPFYTIDTNGPDPQSSDKLYYLGLARVPTLKTLNYAIITQREREEGEIYYLSIAAKEIQNLFTSSPPSSSANTTTLANQARQLHPRYQALCQKYSRESVIDQLLSLQTSTSSTPATASHQPAYPAGSLGARLVTATFYIPSSHVSTTPTITQQLPLSLPGSYLMGHLLHNPTFASYLKPLQFNLIYESTELDPVDTTAESSTRSTMYARGHKLSQQEKETIWKEWGDWDADAVIEEVHAREINGRGSGDGDGDGDGAEEDGDASAKDEHWTKDGYLMRDGKKWKHREIEILHSVRRPWGDWIDIKSGGPEREVRVRIEPFERAR